MSPNQDNHKPSVSLPSEEVGSGSAMLEQNSSQTIKLSESAVKLAESATLAVSNEKASVLTTDGMVASQSNASSTTTSILSDATVIRNRNDQQSFTGSRSSNVNSSSTDNSSNANVEIVSDALIGSPNSQSFQLGDYQVLELIGGGGMGRIYRARDIRLDRDVALKILAPNQQSEEFKERFIVEAKASAKLHHDNIVLVYSFEQTDGVMYLVMEYISGNNIRDIVTKKGPLPIEDVLSYAIQLASALEHINEKGIVHRDIKPSNVLITDDGTLKVIDLGLAKNTIEPDNDLTQTGVTLGTFDYISPEQARDPRKVDIRSDIYSLGCSLFFMLTGQPPYPKGTGLQKLLRHQGDAAPNVQDFRSDVPDRFAGIIMRCMAKDANLRYQTPQDLSKALYIAAEEQGMRPNGISLAKWYFPSRSRLRVWKDRLAWAVPIVVLVGVIMILDYIWKPNQRQAEFLPEMPGLKRNVAAVNSSGRSSSIFGLPVKRGKALEFDGSAPFPQPPEISPIGNESIMTLRSEESNEPVDNNSSAAVQVPAAPTIAPPEPASEPVKVHSVKFETD